MINKLSKAAIFIAFVVCTSVIASNVKMSDDEIREAIIQESILSYPGNCPCPYSRAKNGSKCGGRSAYSRAGGYSPSCYKSDVSKETVDNYKNRKQ